MPCRTSSSSRCAAASLSDHSAFAALSASDFAAAIYHLHTNQTAWQEISRNGAKYARSGAGGMGVCPAGLGDDWLAFWGKMQTGGCSGVFG